MNFDEYRKKKQTIIEKLSCTKSIIVEPKLASEYDFKNYSKQISADIENLKNEEHRIVVVGSYGAGKTTFMKALLGFEHLPAKHGENTAALAYFRKANSNQLNGTVTVKLSESSTVELNALHDIYLFLETPGEDSPKRLDDVKKYFTDNLNEYYTDLGGFDPARDVLSVDVWLDNPLLNNDVVLIDSPGIGSVSRQHEAITREEIFRADAVIYLFNSNQLGGSGDEKFIGDILSITKNIMFTINKKDVVDKNPLNEESWDEIIQHLIVDLNRSKIINYDQFPGIIPFSAGYAWNVINEDQKALSAENNQLKKLGMPEYKNFDEMYIASNFEAVREKVERIATTVSNDQRGERSLKIDRYEESATNLTKRIIDILDTAHKNLKENEDSDYEAEISDYRAKIEELDKKSLKITEILKDNKKGEYETWFNIQKDQDLEKITARLNEINIDNAQNADNVAGVAAQLERIINSSRENYLNQIEQVIEDVGRDLNEEYAFEGLAHEIETIDMPTYDYDAEKVRGLEHELEELKKGYERTNTELKKHESKIDFNKNEIEGHKAHIDQAHKMIEDIKKMGQKIGNRPGVKVINHSDPVYRTDKSYWGLKQTTVYLGDKKRQETDDSEGRAWDRQLERLQDEVKDYHKLKQSDHKKRLEFDRINDELQRLAREKLEKLNDINLDINQKKIDRDLLEENERKRAYVKLKSALRNSSQHAFETWLDKFSPGQVDATFNDQFEYLKSLELEFRTKKLNAYASEIDTLEKQKNFSKGEIDRQIELVVNAIGELSFC